MLNVFCLIVGLNSSNPDTKYGEFLLSLPLSVAAVAPTDPLEWERTRLACRGYCIEQGITLTAWSTVFRQPDSFAWDCRWTKQCLLDLKACPPETDMKYFMYWKPHVRERLLFNRAFQRHLEKCVEDPWTINHEKVTLINAKTENERLYVIWSYLGDAFNGSTPYQRRAGLHNLKLFLGDEAYNNAEMPPNVPDWAFNELE